MVAVGCGVAPPERPSPLRVCSWLFNNTLTGSVPSWLSALTNLAFLCVPPFLPTALVRAAEEGRDRWALLERAACRVEASLEPSSGGGAAAGLLRRSQRPLHVM